MATVRQRPSSLPPELLFAIGAVSQYIGAAIAVNLFDQMAPETVAWLRVIGATAVLLAVSPRFYRGWSPRALAGAAIFGISTALMNLFFYQAISRIDLGKSVAIEFIGPIAVAAATTRSTRNTLALVLTTAGVVTLGGVEIGSNLVGVGFVLAASAMWAIYIVVGSRIALTHSGLSGLGVGLAIGAIVLTPIGAPSSGPVWGSPTLVGLALATGVFSNAIGYGIDQSILRRIPVRRFSVLLAGLPVVAALVGWVALGQQPGAIDLVGIGCVLVGVAVQSRDTIDADGDAVPLTG